MEYVRYIVNKETDFTENGVDKINVDISVIIKIAGTEVSLPLNVINNNSQTGSEMDAQRETEVQNFVSSLN